MQAIIVISEPGLPDYARGLLEILASDEALPLFGNTLILHAHSFSDDEWPAPYLAADIPVAADDSAEGFVLRLNAAFEYAVGAGCEQVVVCDCRLWPLRPQLLDSLLKRVAGGKLFAGAAMKTSDLDDFPVGGLWPELFAVDTTWAHNRDFFPLPWEDWQRTSLLAAASWQSLDLASFLSAVYFRTVTHGIALGEQQDIAHDSLARISPLEPVQLKTIQNTWHPLALTREHNLHKRRDFVERLGAAHWGPTLERLVVRGPDGWFNKPHAHPSLTRKFKR